MLTHFLCKYVMHDAICETAVAALGRRSLTCYMGCKKNDKVCDRVCRKMMITHILDGIE